MLLLVQKMRGNIMPIKMLLALSYFYPNGLETSAEKLLDYLKDHRKKLNKYYKKSKKELDAQSPSGVNRMLTEDSIYSFYDLAMVRVNIGELELSINKQSKKIIELFLELQDDVERLEELNTHALFKDIRKHRSMRSEKARARNTQDPQNLTSN
jgi:hypothetical protein